MKLTILGCSGSVPSPNNPASGYLVSFPDAPSIVMDLGPGTFAALQKIQDPCDAHLTFSHLHADHCTDFPSLMVWRRFHPDAPAASRNFMFGPHDAPTHLGRMSADHIDEVDDFSDSFAFSAWEHGKRELIDDVYMTPFHAIHPIEAFSLRMEHTKTGKVICYSGDTAYTEDLVPAANNADIFLAEAAWGCEAEGRPQGMHMSGNQAGRLATLADVKKLVLVHLQPWSDPQSTLDAARSEFDGEIVLGAPGLEFEL